MIFAEKLIQLRKKNGWSQEDLAQQMDVSRQSVSKWESAQSIPDLDKIIKLSDLFGVTVDYLLKDNIQAEESSLQKDMPKERFVSMEEANEFIQLKQIQAKYMAGGVFLCIISPVCLFILGVLSEDSRFMIKESTAAGAGLIIMFAIIAAAVALFIHCGSLVSKYAFLDNSYFETAYGVSGMIKRRKEEFKPIYTKNNILGVTLCILSLVPLFMGIIINENSNITMVLSLCLMIFIIAAGVYLFVRVGVVQGSFDRILREGDFEKTIIIENDSDKKYMDAVSTIYWSVVLAIYLGYSFINDAWAISWVVWVVAGVLFPAVKAIVHLIVKK